MANNVDLCRFQPSNTGTGQGTPTFTNGSAVINQTAHGYVANQPVFFTTTGTLPTNFSPQTVYYVIATGLTANAFEVSATVGGSAISAGSAGSGTHTANGGIQVGSAVTGFETPANAGCVDSTPGASGKCYAYAIFDSLNGLSESGLTWFNSTQTMMVRMPLHSSPSGSAPINFGASAQVAITAISANINALPGFLYGCTMSNDGVTPNTKMDIGTGYCTDDTNSVSINVSTALVIDCTTTGANGMDSGSLPTTGTTHFFVIMKLDGTVAGLASTSLTPTLPTGYFFKRRIHSMLTDGSAHLRGFINDGDRIRYLLPLADVASTTAFVDALAHLLVLSVPNGLKVEAEFEIGMAGNTGGCGVVLTSPDETDRQAYGAGGFSYDASAFAQGSSGFINAVFRRMTNTSSQIRYRAQNTNGQWGVYTMGWTDRRGRDG